MEISSKAALGLLCSVFSIVGIPTIGYIYAQGQDNAVQLQLTSSVDKLSHSVDDLADETAELKDELHNTVVKSEATEEKVKKLEVETTNIRQRVRDVEITATRLDAKRS